nr:hypothetical protein [Tanacetum cinerariifolium]
LASAAICQKWGCYINTPGSDEDSIELKELMAFSTNMSSKLFWDSIKKKTVNREAQLQALVDKKKVIITETTIRRALMRKDAGGIDCLPNEAIFEQLALRDSRNKFLMFSRFVQVFLNKQVEGMSKHNVVYVIPSHTKKVFANMKRENQGFSWTVTPLFLTIMVNEQE